jgi:hypothetical protein
MDIITIEPMILEIFKKFTLQNENLQIYVVDFCCFHKMNHFKIHTPCISRRTFIEAKELHFHYGLCCVLDCHMFIFFIVCHQFPIYYNFNIFLERKFLKKIVVVMLVVVLTSVLTKVSWTTLVKTQLKLEEIW